MQIQLQDNELISKSYQYNSCNVMISRHIGINLYNETNRNQLKIE